MSITPLEIQKKKFNRTFRGYDETEVENFLEDLSIQVTSLIKENNENKDRIRNLEIKITELQDREKTVNETLSVVRKISEDMKENAKKKSDAIIAEAKHSAKEIFLKTEIEQLMYRKKDVKTSLIGYLKNQIALIETHDMNYSKPEEASITLKEEASITISQKPENSVLDDIPIDLRRNRDFSIFNAPSGGQRTSN